MGFFTGFGQKISNVASLLGHKISEGANHLGGKVSKIANFVGNIAEDVAPTLAVINPELGALASGIGAGARVAQGLGNTIQQSIRDYRNRANTG